MLLVLFFFALAIAKNVGVVNLHFQSHQPATEEKYRVSSDSSIKGRPLNLEKRAESNGSLLAELKNEGTFYSVPLKLGSNQDTVLVLVDTGSSDLWVSDSSNAYCRKRSSSSRVEQGQKQRSGLQFDKQKLPFSVDIKQSEPLAKYRIIDDKDAYNLHVGTPSQSVDVENKVVGYNSQSIYPTMDCSEYGTFNSSASDTFKSNDTAFFISYADKTYAYGVWGVDNAIMHDLKIDDLTFAVANESDSEMGVLGIGLEGLESTNVGVLAGDEYEPYTYSNFPSKLVQDGLINRRVYSLYLDTNDSDSGSILFGGVDHAKYDGTLQLLPLLNTYYGTYDKPLRFELTLTNIVARVDNSSASFLNSPYYANLDSGTTYTYMPTRLLDSIASSLGLLWSYSSQVYYTTCPSDSVLNKSDITFNFQGVEIKVPLKNFFVKDTGSSSRNLCVFTILESSGYVILGDNFLREAYVVYDLDNYEIGLAQVKFTKEENVEVIKSAIPSAVSAADYSKTLDIESIYSALNNTSYGATSTGSRSSTTPLIATGSKLSSLNPTTRSYTGYSSSTSSATRNPTRNSGSATFGHKLENSLILLVVVLIPIGVLLV